MISWADGLQLEVTDIQHGTAGGQGPGALPDRATTTFSLRLTNHTSSKIDASQVVMTAVYGKDPRRLASPVYDERAADFAGVIERGASTTAAYTFAIPKTRLSAVELTLDIDANHSPGTFSGSAS
jgi:hypothetical protein